MIYIVFIAGVLTGFALTIGGLLLWARSNDDWESFSRRETARQVADAEQPSPRTFRDTDIAKLNIEGE